MKITKKRLAVLGLVHVLLALSISQFVSIHRQPQDPRQQQDYLKEPLQDPSLGVMVTSPSAEDHPAITAVFVEIRCHSGISLVLQQAIAHFGLQSIDFRIVVWHATQNQLYIQGLVAANSILNESFETQQLKLRLFRPQDYGTSTQSKNIYSGTFWYQRLLTSESFWQDESIETPLVVTMQSDTLICRPPDMELLRTSPFLGGVSGFTKNSTTNVGAADALKKVKVGINPRNAPTQSFLNGGFSLHNVSWTIDCIKTYGTLKVKGWVEDDLFNFCRQQIQGSMPVTEVEAYSFASDNGVTLCFDVEGRRRCPFAVHKPWQNKGNRYDELVASCPEVERLERLQFVQQGRYCNASDTESDVIKFECNCSRPRYSKVRTVSRGGSTN